MDVHEFQLRSGSAGPLGATIHPDGVNFAVFSQHATAIELCLFIDGKQTRIKMRERTGAIWHLFVEGLGAGTQYGYRVHGVYDPANGHRFNPSKLLIDPYARELAGEIADDDTIYGYGYHGKAVDLGIDHRDSAPAVPKSVVSDIAPLPHDRPQIEPSKRIVYEAHAKGLTQEFPDLPDDIRGTYRALAHPRVLDYLSGLGVTSVELLPIHTPHQERFFLERGFRNYWGYQTISFFTPYAEYAATQNAPREFQETVKAIHEAGMEVILDVVYNHTGEGDELGPTLSFRGLDNASYYRLADDPRYYNNDAGTGNTLDLTNPHVLRMVLDSMRYWVEVMGVDGFRFDLGTILGREAHGFDKRGGFFDALLQDPVLSQVVLIAEPWDLGVGGYQSGNWPSPFLEWNDRYRDDLRAFWRGDAHMAPGFAEAITGSSIKFDHSYRSALSSVNFVTAHDGFNLRDLVTYVEKHNHANQEDNKDGHNHNISDNFGVEGETNDPNINAKRAQRVRNFILTMMISQGTPMLLAGDEIGNSQGGNNNVFAQDNPTGWVNWDSMDGNLLAFTKRAIALRHSTALLRQRYFLHGKKRTDGAPDIIWLRADGQAPSAEDWHTHDFGTFAMVLRGSATAPFYTDDEGDAVMVITNRVGATEFKLPTPPTGAKWQMTLDTANPNKQPFPVSDDHIAVSAASMIVLESI